MLKSTTASLKPAEVEKKWIVIDAENAVVGRLASFIAMRVLRPGDFIKTSTGKTKISATAEAARIMLGAIATNPDAAQRVGFKPSGGIRTVGDAAVYIALVEEILGAAALRPQRFRIGASSILTDIEAVL